MLHGHREAFPTPATFPPCTSLHLHFQISLRLLYYILNCTDLHMMYFHLLSILWHLHTSHFEVIIFIITKSNRKAPEPSGLPTVITKLCTGFEANAGSWSLLWITVQLEGCTSSTGPCSPCSTSTSLVSRKQQSEKPHEILPLSLGKKRGENAGGSSVRSGSTCLVAFQSPLFPDAASGKAAHASLMNGILFNTSNWAAALSSCIAQAKCHDPGRQGEAMARAGSPAAHDPAAGHDAPQVTR